MALPVRPHRETASGMNENYAIYEVVSAYANSDPQLEFLPEKAGDPLVKEPVYIIEPVPSRPSRDVAQRPPQEHSRIVPPSTRPRFLRVRDPRPILLTVRRGVAAALLAAYRVLAGTFLVLRGDVVRMYHAGRRTTPQLALWIGRLGARVLERATSIVIAGVSRIRRFDGVVRTNGREFWRLCGAATRLAGAVSAASLRALVGRIPSSPHLMTQMSSLALDISRLRLPVANLTLAAFGGGVVVGACIMWLVGALPASPRLADSPVTLASGVAASEPHADDRSATVYPAAFVARPIELQNRDRAPLPVPAPVGVVSTAITVTSAPTGARVTIDGIGWGETPVTIHHLTPGQKMIRVTKEGYESQQRIISVPADRRSMAVQLSLRSRQRAQLLPGRPTPSLP
jgi:hypothetical protein